MLPTHTTYRKSFFVFFILLVIFVSCSDRSKNDREIIQALDESIVSSNQLLAASSHEVMVAFEEKLRDASGERSRLWYPKALKIQQLSNEILIFIESIKADINSRPNFSSDLFEKLKNYKKDILLVDPKITDKFQKSLKIFTSTIDSTKRNQKELFLNHFHNVSTMSALAMLNKMQNNVRVIEEKVIAFCYEQSSRLSFGPCIKDFPIAIMSSTFVQAGERIEIFAGVGEFRSDMKCEIFIYGKEVKIKDDAIAHYKLKAASRPGKYYVPVKINYTDQNGKQQTVQKEIEYTVAKIQQQ